MNKFRFYWSCVDLLSAGLAIGILNSDWLYYPGLGELRLIVLCFAYWLLLSLLQKQILFWKFRNRQFCDRWFFISIAAGFLPMLLHHSIVTSSSDFVGQGVLILWLSLPCLAVIGGLISATATFLLFKSHSRRKMKFSVRDVIWLIVNVFKWLIGFAVANLYFWGSFLPILIFLFISIAIIEAWMIERYLQILAMR